MQDPIYTGTSKGVPKALNGGPIRKFLPNYPYLYATIQSHGYSEDVQTQYGIANEVRNGLSIMVAC